MAEEGGTPQDPPVEASVTTAAVPKATAAAPRPGPAGTTSSFINKGAGKKFGPKAVQRRRPAPAPAKAAATTPIAPSTSEDQQPPATASETESRVTSAPALPTPSATQEVAPRTEEANVQTIAPTPEPSSTEPSHAAPVQTTLSPSRQATPRPAEDELNRERSPKRRRVEVIAAEEETIAQPAVSGSQSRVVEEAASQSQETQAQDAQDLDSVSHVGPQVGSQTAQTSLTEARDDVDLVDSSAEVPASGGNDGNTAATATQNTVGNNTAGNVPAQNGQTAQGRPLRRGRAQQWTAVNQPQNGASGTQAAKPKVPGRIWAARNKAKEARLQREREAAEAARAAEQNVEETDSAIVGRRRGTRRRTRRGVQEEVQEDLEADEDDEDAFEPAPVRPPKKTAAKPKAVRRRKPTAAAANVNGAVNGATPAADGATPADGEAEQQPRKRRGRPARENTPSDAEDHIIDASNTLMCSLAVRDTRKGRISEREKKMRDIDWAKVRKERREQEMMVPDRWETQREVNERLARAEEARIEADNANDPNKSRPAVLVDGVAVLQEESRPTEREVNERGFEDMETVENEDLKQRINTRSFMRDNKRFPQDFILPGQGKRWNAELTEKFYEALQVFGTDFTMVNTILPGMTRRSIKLKFNREERENPVGIKNALRAERTADWSEYLERAGKTEEAFRDPEVIKAELEKEAEVWRVQIDEAKKNREEYRRQRRMAGLPESEDEAAADKENKSKKTRKKRNPKPIFDDSGINGAEVLEEVVEE